MPGPAIQLERRRLNEEIENAFIIAAQAAANVEMKLSMGKGAIFGDAQDFFGHFTYLLRLTINLKEMEAKEDSELGKLKNKTMVWKKRKVPMNANEQELERYLTEGLSIFDEYYRMLMHVGIIALPTKKG